ncbi:MAG: ECF transporter S component [Thermoclostridium sp.]|nr:ECF transporter S component [Thermoclostridium sp.]
MEKNNVQINKIVLTGLMTALVILSTSFVKIPAANGYIHLGDGFVFLSAIILGPFYGAFAAGVGSMAADILGGYAQWALPTLLIKSSMAMLMGLISRQKTKKQTYISAGATVLIWTAFFITIKNALVNAVQFSAEGLAQTVGDTAENIMQRAGEIQWKLSAAILVFLVIVFILLVWLMKKQTEGFGPGMVLGIMSAGACMVIGYYLAEALIYGNPISPAFSVPMNLIQFIVGIFITAAITPILVKTKMTIGQGSRFLSSI